MANMSDIEAQRIAARIDTDMLICWRYRSAINNLEMAESRGC